MPYSTINPTMPSIKYYDCLLKVESYDYLLYSNIYIDLMNLHRLPTLQWNPTVIAYSTVKFYVTLPWTCTIIAYSLQ